MPEPSISEILLAEVRETRAEVSRLRTDLSELTVQHATLSAALKPLLPNGKPGKIAEMETAIRDLERWKYRVIGISVGAGAVISVILKFSMGLH